MRKLLGFLIAAVLAGAVAAALVKSDEEPLAGPTDLPTQTASETPTPGETPTLVETPSLTPGVTDPPSVAGQTPSGQTTEPSPSMSELPRTGDGSAAGPALLSILLATGAGIAVRRTASRA